MISVTCAIIVKDGFVLAVQRSEAMDMPLKWEFPGGKVEEKEDEQECIKREIKEELNIDIDVQSRLAPTIHDYGHIKIQLIPYLATITSGEIKLIEHKTYLWLSPSSLLELDWAEADVPVLHQLLNLH